MPQTVPSLEEHILGYVRPLRPLYRESSLSAAVEALREFGGELVPVLDGSLLAGVVWADDLRTAVLSGESLEQSLVSRMDRNPPRLPANATVENARMMLMNAGRGCAVVTDTEGRYVGVLFALDLFHRPATEVKPPFIGGMATPFGVFLTNGDVSGGAGPLALVATGAMLFSLLMIGVAVTIGLLEWFGRDLSIPAQELLLTIAPTAVFFGLLRGLPLSGTHGAEHMVVHAIERREPLTVEVVRRMPRVHPRCGTNFAVGAMLFMWLVQVTRSHFQEIGALLALVATLLLWRPIGAVFQQFVTTKTPSDSQLRSAIAAGEQLLQRFKQSPRPSPTFGRRLVMSGLPWVLAGSLLAYGVAYALLSAVGADPAGWLG
jgi:CBS domain-containing protein